MSPKSMFGLALVAVGLLVASSSLYVVKETERAVLLKFGAVEEADVKPGLHFKVPIMNEVRKFDGRVLTLDTQPQNYMTVEKKGMIVDYFAKWQIIDVEKFYTATGGDTNNANRLMAQRINEGLRNQFAKRSLLEVVSGERDELMDKLTDDLDGFSRSSLGIHLIDVRVKQIELPQEVSGSVYNRMTAEREREAREHRSKGKEQAEFIMADADRQKTVIEAEAYRDAERIRGEGDAIAAANYANAYNKDPEFYTFVRSLNAYKKAFQDKQDVMLVDPNSEFFRYLKDAQGKQ
ncbi:protease modulator HflC [Simiduia agarivorans]|uniref:Protein HflC n=1 Tax=Simiduia agarivorans (strain DSM 21679 / JCM 13881 / BCRC 17597 / SA1) TaxID=1117647 RepID=K4KPP8_SIMAS|nr:protease modulator HflC [Simiduia agarivorans]AFV00206.1 protease subunit HflC [Simiduia agarivorans SA1 = DSM 21679]